MNRTDIRFDPAAAWASAIARSPLAMIIVDGPDQVISASNYAFGTLLGEPGERLAGRRLGEVLSGAAATAAVRIVERVHRTARPEYGIEVEVVRDVPPPNYWRLAAWPILDLDDRPEGVCLQASDVTAHVAARHRERELAEEIREANDRLLQAGIREQGLAEAARRYAEEIDRLLHSLTEGVAILDREAGVAMMNAVGRSILGIGSEEERVPIGAYRELEFTTPDGTPVAFEAWPFHRALAGERFANEEFIVTRPDGSRVRVAFHGSGIPGDARGSALGIVVFRDVTQLRRLEELQSQYASLISHDLRAPLGAVLGYAELLEPDLQRRGLKRAAGFARQVQSAAERMRRMLDDLTQSAGSDAGGFELRREPTDLGTLIARALKDITLPESRARVVTEVPAPAPRVFVDPQRLPHAIMNLVTNALKYSPPPARVVVRVARGAGEIRISVKDSGPGILPEDLPRLFQRFYRGAGAKRGEGLGLGLYIARLIVEAHGGRIWAESEAGEGSTFHLALPVEVVIPAE